MSGRLKSYLWKHTTHARLMLQVSHSATDFSYSFRQLNGKVMISYIEANQQNLELRNTN